MSMLHNCLQVDYKGTQMTHDISMLKKIFLLHIRLSTYETHHQYAQ